MRSFLTPLLVVAVWLAVVQGQTNNYGLYTSNATAIIFIPKDTTNQHVVYSDSYGRIIGLAVDTADQKIFWSDAGYGSRGIYSADLNGQGEVQNVAKIVSQDLSEVEGLTVDWVSKHIYWTDARKKTIEVADYDGGNRVTLFVSNLIQPRGIWADPINRYLFWTDQGSMKIERSNLDGSDRKILVENIQWPNELVTYNSKLYWVSGKTQTLTSSDFEGDSVTEVKNLSGESGTDNPIYGLSIFDNKAYITSWKTGKVLSVDVTTKIVTTAHSKLGADNLFGTVYVDANSQSSGTNGCSSNHQCIGLCLPTTGSSKRCTCPSYGGKTAVGTACNTPNNIMVYALADAGVVGFVNADSTASPNKDLYIVGRSLRPVAVAYDPVDQYVYWSDVHERTIHKAKYDGSDHKIFMDYSHALGIVDGLAIDYNQRRLYFSNMGQVVVKDNTYSWHKIETINLDGTDRKIVVNNVGRPRGLWLDLTSKVLFYGDWGSKASINRVNLDGSNHVVLVSGLDNPNGLIKDGDFLYYVDSHAKTRDNETNRNYPGPEKQGALYRLDVGKNDKPDMITGLDMEIPFGIAIHSGKMYISDWETREILSIPHPPTNSPVQTKFLTDVTTPMGLVTSPLTRSAGNTVCAPNTCADICFDDPSNGQNTCTCSSYDAMVLTASNQCSKPSDFFIIADMNSIKLIGLSGEDRSQNIIVQGNGYFSNFAGMAYNSATETLYWSDVNKKSIMYQKIGANESQTFMNTEDIIDGLTIHNNKMYWTDYLGGIIARVGLDNSSYVELVKDLKQPRAIVVTDSKIYWTEWGNPPAVKRSDLQGKNIKTLVQGSKLQWPNGLFIEDNDMYIADGRLRTILKCDLTATDIDGSCKELSFITEVPEHIYDIKKKGNILYLTDWYSGALFAADMNKGEIAPVVEGLMRPTQTIVIYDSDATLQCNPSGNRCVDKDNCTRVLGYPNNEKCFCGAGYFLKSDGITCEQATYKYEEANPGNCKTVCTESQDCVRKVGTNEYSCQCMAGKTGDSCSDCSSDQYKLAPGSDACTACGGDATSVSGSKVCTCSVGKVWDWKLNTCAATAPQDTEECGFGGEVYIPGETYVPNVCIECKCDRDKRNGHPDYGYGQCAVIGCIPPPCSKDEWEYPAEECCPRCPAPEGCGIKLRCPDDIVEVDMPAGRTYIEYDPLEDIAVIDDCGLNRKPDWTITPSRSTFTWKGTTPYTIQASASARAPSGSYDEAKCSFKMLVKDIAPPVITCPGDVEEYAEKGASEKVVKWALPVVNEAKADLAGNYQSGQSFKPGRYDVEYTATDEAGNEGSCTFNVLVQEALKCPNAVIPYNGLLRCNTDGGDGETCKSSCNPGFEHNSDMADSFTCIAATWNPAFPSRLRTEGCVKIQKKRINAEATLVFENIGDLQLDELLAILIEKLTSSFTETTLRGVTFKFKVAASSGVSRKRRSLDRFRRQTTDDVIVDIYIIAEKDPTADVSDDEIKDELQAILDAIKDSIDRGNFDLPGDIQPIIQDANVNDASCIPGEEEVNDQCVSCPFGTSFDLGSKTCEQCDIGTYQPYLAQIQCLSCGEERTTVGAGSYEESQCVGKEITTNGPPMGIIIGAVVGVLVVVIIIIIVVVVVKNRSKDKGDKAGENGNGNHNNPAFDNGYDEIPADKASAPDNPYEGIDKSKASETHIYEKA